MGDLKINRVMRTPGPWRIDLDHEYDSGWGYNKDPGAIVGPNNELVVAFDPSEGEFIAALWRDSDDARLIAAAPELLDAAKIVYQATAPINKLNEHPYIEKYRNILWAAISKAEGIAAHEVKELDK